MYEYAISIGTLLSFLTALGVLFATYFNFKKLSDNIRAEERWRATVDTKLESIQSDVKLIKTLEKQSQRLTAKHDVFEKDLEIMKKDINSLWQEFRDHRKVES